MIMSQHKREQAARAALKEVLDHMTDDEIMKFAHVMQKHENSRKYTVGINQCEDLYGLLLKNQTADERHRFNLQYVDKTLNDRLIILEKINNGVNLDGILNEGAELSKKIIQDILRNNMISYNPETLTFEVNEKPYISPSKHSASITKKLNGNNAILMREAKLLQDNKKEQFAKEIQCIADSLPENTSANKKVQLDVATKLAQLQRYKRYADPAYNIVPNINTSSGSSGIASILLSKENEQWINKALQTLNAIKDTRIRPPEDQMMQKYIKEQIDLIIECTNSEYLSDLILANKNLENVLTSQKNNKKTFNEIIAYYHVEKIRSEICEKPITSRESFIESLKSPVDKIKQIREISIKLEGPWRKDVIMHNYLDEKLKSLALVENIDIEQIKNIDKELSDILKGQEATKSINTIIAKLEAKDADLDTMMPAIGYRDKIHEIRMAVMAIPVEKRCLLAITESEEPEIKAVFNAMNRHRIFFGRGETTSFKDFKKMLANTKTNPKEYELEMQQLNSLKKK
ncbi:MAG: hypothetical protein A3F46_00275 [Legionellales bacterium RIFCSPHIGHO2_12_FULL_42_9]|nr:MAG: hypothetical protein A3F46_00275 [Legionellales bacterium RIFCSPHIGHO2_12_FULL_42_9]